MLGGMGVDLSKSAHHIVLAIGQSGLSLQAEKEREKEKKCRGHIMTSYHVRSFPLSALFPIASQGLALLHAWCHPSFVLYQASSQAILFALVVVCVRRGRVVYPFIVISIQWDLLNKYYQVPVDEPR